MKIFLKNTRKYFLRTKCLIVFCSLFLFSCSSYNKYNFWGKSDNGDYFGTIENNKFNVKFYSLGARKLENKFYSNRYGNHIFTYKDYFTNNKIYINLFQLNSFYEIPQNNNIAELYDLRAVNCFDIIEKKRKKIVYKRYFQKNGKKFLLMIDFKKIGDNKMYDPKMYIDQEMKGLIIE